MRGRRDGTIIWKVRGMNVLPIYGINIHNILDIGKALNGRKIKD